MLRLSRIFKNYSETGSLSEQINLYGFIGPQCFSPRPVRWASSSKFAASITSASTARRLTDSPSVSNPRLKLFDENCRVYQYLFKRNNEAIPYKLYDNPIVDAAIKNRIAYLASKADTLFSLSVYYVVLYQGFQTSDKLGTALAELPKNPKRALCGSASAILGSKADRRSWAACQQCSSGAAAKGAQLYSPSQRFSRRPHSRQTRSLPRSEENTQLSSRQARTRQAASTTPSSTTTCPNLPSNVTADICAWTTTT